MKRGEEGPVQSGSEGHAERRFSLLRHSSGASARRRSNKRKNHSDSGGHLEGRGSARWRRPSARVLLVLVALLVVDGAYLGIRAVVIFRTTVAHFQRGAESLVAGDLPGARDGFHDARTSSRGGGILASGFAAAPWRLFPWFARDARVADSLARSGELAAQAGLQLVDASDAVGVSKEHLISSIYRDGRVRLVALRKGEPFIENAASIMAQAVSALKDAPEPFLLQGRFDSQLERVADASTSLRMTHVAFQALPSLLGQLEPRRYYIAFQAPSEQRGGGGLISLWGLLTADRGRLKLSKVRAISELVPLLDHPVEGPGWFTHLYGPMSGLSQWQQANSSPNFPVVAPILLRMYRESKGQRLDGVLGMDPVALGYLTQATGPLMAKGFDVEVGPDNAVDVLLNESYTHFAEPERQNRYLSRLIAQFWDRLSAGAFDAPTLVTALGRSITERHFRAFSVRPDDQQALQELGVDGGYGNLGPNLQSVFHNNGLPNKVDFFLHRTVDTTVQLTQRGDAQVTTTAVLHNGAPEGPPSIQLGPSTKGSTPGLNRMILEFLVPQGAQLETMTLNNGRVSAHRGREEDFPVFWQIFDIPPDSTAVVTLRYVVPHAFEPSAEGGTFSMSLLPQPAVRPDEYYLRVIPPYGSRVIGTDDDNGSAIFAGELAETRTFKVRFSSG